ncbi:MAG: alpha/beta fold hydrolase [Myxococcaceae bacterium]
MASPNKSTTVRIASFLARAAETVAPDWVTEQAFLAFCRPQRFAPRFGTLEASGRGFRLDPGTGELGAWEWNSGGHAGTALLVHGWSGNASHLRAFVGPLVERGFHVVAVDLPAHGTSPGTFATLMVMADAVRELVHRLQPRLVVAHSLGATATTLALLPRVVDAGLAVERVVLLAPPVEMPPYLRHFAQQVGLSEAVQARVLERIEKTIGRPVTELDLRRNARHLAGVRALVVHDRDDVVTPAAGSRALVSQWPGARLLETGGLGHDGVRKAREVVEAAMAFVTGESARAGAGETTAA